MSIINLPVSLNREVCSFLGNADLMSFANTSSSNKQLVAEIPAQAWRRRVNSQGILLWGNTAPLRQIQDLAFEKGLSMRVNEAWIKSLPTIFDPPATLRIVLGVVASAAIAGGPIGDRIATVATSTPLFFSDRCYYNLTSSSRFLRISFIAVGGIKVIQGTLLYQNHPQLAMDNIAWGGFAILRAIDINERIPEVRAFCNGTRVKCIAYAERAMRTSPCLKVSNKIGAVKRYVRETRAGRAAVCVASCFARVFTSTTHAFLRYLH